MWKDSYIGINSVTVTVDYVATVTSAIPDPPFYQVVYTDAASKSFAFTRDRSILNGSVIPADDFLHTPARYYLCNPHDIEGDLILPVGLAKGKFVAMDMGRCRKCAYRLLFSLDDPPTTSSAPDGSRVWEYYPPIPPDDIPPRPNDDLYLNLEPDSLQPQSLSYISCRCSGSPDTREGITRFPCWDSDPDFTPGPVDVNVTVDVPGSSDKDNPRNEEQIITFSTTGFTNVMGSVTLTCPVGVFTLDESVSSTIDPANLQITSVLHGYRIGFINGLGKRPIGALVVSDNTLGAIQRFVSNKKGLFFCTIDGWARGHHYDGDTNSWMENDRLDTTTGGDFPAISGIIIPSDDPCKKLIGGTVITGTLPYLDPVGGYNIKVTTTISVA